MCEFWKYRWILKGGAIDDQSERAFHALLTVWFAFEPNFIASLISAVYVLRPLCPPLIGNKKNVPINVSNLALLLSPSSLTVAARWVSGRMKSSVWLISRTNLPKWHRGAEWRKQACKSVLWSLSDSFSLKESHTPVDPSMHKSC